jgi:uncharacterized protein YdaU (DUF1376 family)
MARTQPTKLSKVEARAEDMLRTASTMSTLEFGAFVKLALAACFEQPPGTVPHNDQWLARHAGVSPVEWPAIRDAVLLAWTSVDGRYQLPCLIQQADRLSRGRAKARGRMEHVRACSREQRRTRANMREHQRNTREPPPYPPIEPGVSVSGAGAPDTPTPRRGKRGGSGGAGGDKPREPNPLWDALCAAFRLNPVAKAERSRVGRVVAALREKGAAPGDIAERMADYRRSMPRAVCTPEALLKHWDQLAAGTLAYDPAGDPDATGDDGGMPPRPTGEALRRMLDEAFGGAGDAA